MERIASEREEIAMNAATLRAARRARARARVCARVAHAGNERVNESVISVIKIHNSFSIFDKRHLIHLSFFVPYHIFDVCAYGVRLVLSPFGARGERTTRRCVTRARIDVHG